MAPTSQISNTIKTYKVTEGKWGYGKQHFYVKVTVTILMKLLTMSEVYGVATVETSLLHCKIYVMLNSGKINN